jgi:prevent-host-death family protein
MGRIWPLQDAKAKLSQVIRAAETEPQKITRHGEEVGVLLSPQEYERLLKLSGQKTTKGLPRWWTEAPKVSLEIPRRSGRMRKVEL